MRHIHGSAFTSLAGARLTRTAPLLLVLMLSACGNDSESPGTARLFRASFSPAHQRPAHRRYPLHTTTCTPRHWSPPMAASP